MIKKSKNIETADSPAPRRSFLLKLWAGLGVVAFAELIWVMWSFLKPRRGYVHKKEFGSMMEAGSVDGFSKDSVTAFPRGRFYLVRLEEGGFLALHRRCTHLGCTVPWNNEENRFLCPCHSSAYDIRGDVIRSPAPRALDIFPITIENNVIHVDTGRVVKRSGFKSDQVIYPKA